MRHHNTQRKFGRKSNVRKAFFRSLLIALIEHKRITTTEARAKEIRPLIEKLITKARGAGLTERRSIISALGNQPEVANKLIEEIAPQYEQRPGGYTRIVKLPRRGGDAAEMAIIEFV